MGILTNPMAYITITNSFHFKASTPISPEILLNIVLPSTKSSLNTRKTKYMKIGRHRGMITNEHIKIDIPMKK